MHSVHICPPLAACLKFSFRLLFTVVAVIALIHVGAGLLFSSEPELKGLQNPAKLFLVLAVLAAALGAAIYGVYRWSAVTIDQTGISGRGFWGRKRYFPWSDVESVRRTAVNGAPALVVVSRTGGELWCYILGIDVGATYVELCQAIGSDHSFTQVFKP